MSEQCNILVVDDEPDIRKLIKDILEDEGYAVRIAANGAAARKAITQKKPDLMLLDIWMPGEDGISLLRSCKVAERHEYPVVVMSGHGTIETAVEATRHGANAFIEKPLTTEKLLQSVRDALAADGDGAASGGVRPVVGRSPAAAALRKAANALAADARPLLVCGGPGVGKRSFAAWVHALGGGAPERFVAVDASDDDKLADALKRAAGGTLFVRHMERLSPTADALLRERPGGTRLAASCSAPGDAAPWLSDAKRAAQVVVPALQERITDLPELLRHSVDHACQHEGMSHRRFPIAAQNRLLDYDWPDNLRELDGMVRELLRVKNRPEITLDEIETALEARSPTASTWFKMLLARPLREAREGFEKAYLENLLREVNGNVSLLAEKTGMGRTHLHRKLRALGVSPKRR